MEDLTPTVRIALRVLADNTVRAAVVEPEALRKEPGPPKAAVPPKSACARPSKTHDDSACFATKVVQSPFSKAKISKFLQIFGGLVLGCIKTKFCKKIYNIKI